MGYWVSWTVTQYMTMMERCWQNYLRQEMLAVPFSGIRLVSPEFVLW